MVGTCVPGHIKAETKWISVDDILKLIFLVQMYCLLIRNSIIFIRMGANNDKPAVVQLVQNKQ